MTLCDLNFVGAGVKAENGAVKRNLVGVGAGNAETKSAVLHGGGVVVASVILTDAEAVASPQSTDLVGLHEKGGVTGAGAEVL